MNITKLRLVGLETVDLPIANATPADPYIFRGADGMGPVEVDVHLAETLYQGAKFQGRRPRNRQAVLGVGLNPTWAEDDPTVEEMRETLYTMLVPGYDDEPVVLQCMLDDEVVAWTNGYVSKVEPDIFSKEPKCLITILCLSPYLESEFVSIPYGELDENEPSFDNPGTAPSGLYMEIVFTGDTSSWAIEHPVSGRTLFEIVYDFENGDNLKINTTPGERSIILTRDAVEYNLIGSMTTESLWLQLYHGLNTFNIMPVDSPYDWLTVGFTPQYWGI